MAERRDTVTAADLPGLMRHVHAALTSAREEVDALNVFPVPDGDTGSNLVRTVACAVEAMDVPDPVGHLDVPARAARGAMRGAAGNSGVIFSQVVRAMCEQISDGGIDVGTLPGVLRRARDLSYDAVAEPVAGTILTAMDAAADAADAAAQDGRPLVEVLADVLDATGEAVAHTRDQLEANRQAGVVDAGARGFEVALDAVRGYLAGEPRPEVVPPPVRRTSGRRQVARESGSSTFAYEVQYLLEAPDEVADEVRTDLQGLGDSVVVVACGGLLNVHVHTNRTDAAVEVGERRGPVNRVEITAFADEGVDVVVPRAPDPVGYLTVMPGSGLVSLCRSLGAAVVHGAAGDLPTVADMLAGIARVHAHEVVLLPAHPNVVPTMRQASEVSVAEGGRRLHVVESVTSVPAALGVLAIAPRDRLDVAALTAAAARIRSAEVVPAVRDADTPVGPVARGQMLVVVEGAVVAAATDPAAALETALERLDASLAELVTLVSGSQVGAHEREATRRLAAEFAPKAEVELVDGQQSPARWFLGVE